MKFPAEFSAIMLALGFIHCYFNSNISSERAGRGLFGTAVFTKFKPAAVSYSIGEATSDSEGRNIIVQFDGMPRIVFTYSPCTGTEVFDLDLRRRHDACLAILASDGNTAIIGDLNVAPEASDNSCPAFGSFTPGCKDFERSAFVTLTTLPEPLVDAFRACNTDSTAASRRLRLTWHRSPLHAKRGWGMRVDHSLIPLQYMQGSEGVSLAGCRRSDSAYQSDHYAIITDFVSTASSLTSDVLEVNDVAAKVKVLPKGVTCIPIGIVGAPVAFRSGSSPVAPPTPASSQTLVQLIPTAAAILGCPVTAGSQQAAYWSSEASASDGRVETISTKPTSHLRYDCPDFSDWESDSDNDGSAVGVSAAPSVI